MKAFVTKYALTKMGILEIEAEVCSGGMIQETDAPYPTFYHGEGRDWHRSRASAVARAEEMRVAKIASLKKQIARLEALKWEVE